MSGLKLLIDTNVVIGLEDAKLVDASWAELVRLSNTHQIGLRIDYPKFDAWFDKCREQHRPCWALKIEDIIAGLVIRKEETHSEAGTKHPGPKILKVCTFKVHDQYLGEKFGELLLKQIFWFAQSNGYDLIYLTAFPKQRFLIDLLKYYGFEETQERNGELVLEKVLPKGPLPQSTLSTLEIARLNYPRFDDRPEVQKFCVPIRSEFHSRLFPEIAKLRELPLFPDDSFGTTNVSDTKHTRTPGNTIRKVYVCRATTNQLRPGDLLFFYLSKDERYVRSQSITTLGIVEQVNLAISTSDLIQLTGKRSVYSVDDLQNLQATMEMPVKVIDFLLVGHLQPPVALETLINKGVLANHPPQSIMSLRPERYAALLPLFSLTHQQ